MYFFLVAVKATLVSLSSLCRAELQGLDRLIDLARGLYDPRRRPVWSSAFLSRNTRVGLLGCQGNCNKLVAYPLSGMLPSRFQMKPVDGNEDGLNGNLVDENQASI